MPDTAELSEKQKACLRLVGQGLTSKEIAQQLGISPMTVDTYLKTAMARMGVSTRKQAARAFEASQIALPQSLGSPSAELADVSKTVNFMPSEAEASQQDRDAVVPPSRPWFPPLGGERNDLEASSVIHVIVRLALMIGGGAAALVAAGLWVMQLLG
jgi:DNA-binding CsgD family transcriptional regulator